MLSSFFYNTPPVSDLSCHSPPNDNSIVAGIQWSERALRSKLSCGMKIVRHHATKREQCVVQTPKVKRIPSDKEHLQVTTSECGWSGWNAL